MVKRLPSQNLAGVYAVHFSPDNLLEIIKLTGLDGFINIFMAQSGLSLDDVVKATKGDFVIAVNDITMKEDTAHTKELKDSVRKHPMTPDVKFLFAVAIGDKDAFNKLTNLGKTMGKEVTEKDLFTKKDDKYFALSNSQENLNNYFSGTQSSPAFLSMINDHPIGAFIDIQMILKGLQSQIAKDSMGKVYYDRNITMWNNLYVTGGEYKDGGIVTKGELNLMDKSTNSLKQLNKYIDDNAKIIIEKKKQEKTERKETMKSDSSAGIKGKPKK
jgi:hypothetical protein